MASFVPSVTVSQIVGSAGGTTFARNRGGNYLKVRKTSKNPQTGYQMALRNLFGSLSSSWRTLSDGQRDGWNTKNTMFPYSNRIGVTKYYSGFQLFIKLNTNLNVSGQTLLTDCPDPYNFLPTSEFYVEHDHIDSLHLGITTLSADSQALYYLYATNGLSAGVNIVSPSTYKYIGQVDFDTYSSLDIHGMYNGRGLIAVTDQRIFFKLVPLSKVSGQFGIPLFTNCIGV